MPEKRKGGRPSREAAERLQDAILDAATALFLRDGYAATSIEAVAATAGISKRTLYARNRDKAQLFQASVARMIARWSPVLTADSAPAGSLSETLTRGAVEILSVALTPAALALHRIMLAEGARFPELSTALREAGANSGAARLGGVLARAIGSGELRPMDPVEAAQRFIALVVAVPQQRAMAGVHDLDALAWAHDSLSLFLDGARAHAADAAAVAERAASAAAS